MNLLDEYFNIQQKIYDYFGYVEKWKVIPLEDRRKYFWYVANDEVYYAKRPEDFDEEIGDHYSDEIYKQRFLSKCIYRAKDYTMICVDTHIDDNKFLAIYDNDKEIIENPFEDEY